jgi:CIC family chloride channel protein
MNASPARLAYLSALAVVLGLAGGGASWVLLRLIAVLTNASLFHRVEWDLPSMANYHPAWWLIPTAMAGGLVISLLAKWAPVIRGHGIPEAMEAVLVRQSRVTPRAALAKPASAAVAIGTGGPFGAEGPIIVTGGALGSLVGQVLRVSPAERKILLAAGAAAGMAATFGAPLAAVVLAIELLLFEFSPRAFLPLAVAASVAAGVHAAYAGTGPLFDVPAHGFSGLGELPVFAALGLLCGLLAVVICKGLFVVEDRYRRLPVSEFWHPVIGGALFATVGMFVPRALGVGYDAINDTLASRLALGTLAALFIAKLIAWWLALGSGTSGGTLAPVLLVGATFGGIYYELLHRMAVGVDVAPSAIVVVAMAAAFGASTRAPFTAIVFAFELTRDYDAILPLIGAVVLADLVSGALLDHHLMTEKLARRGLHVPRAYTPDVLAGTRVADAISVDAPASVDGSRNAPTVPADATLLDAVVRFVADDADNLRVVDTDGQVVGILKRVDVLRIRHDQLASERAEEGWASSVRVRLRRRGRASSPAESRRVPPPGAGPARY